MSAYQQILSHFKQHYPEAYASGAIQRMEWRGKNGRLITPSTVTRELRDMEAKKEIAVRYEGNVNSATYRYLEPRERDNYICTADREDIFKVWKNNNIVKQNKYRIDHVEAERDGQIIRKQVRIML